MSLAVALLFAAGAWHLMGLRAIRKLAKAQNQGGRWSVLFAFWGLALLHLSEIVGGAFVYGAAIHWLDLGTVSGGYGDSTGGLLYLSGVTYATLGFTQQVVEGPLRLMTMVNALTGFMLITWSATYVYSIWGQYYRDESGD
jgi:hypothetical protein